ncbi:hypothetical protein D3C80_1702870 [compost metagenome]
MPDTQAVRLGRPVRQPLLNSGQSAGIPLVLVVGKTLVQGACHAQQGLLAHILQGARHQVQQRLAIRGKLRRRQAIILFIAVAQHIQPELVQAQHAIGMGLEVVLKGKAGGAGGGEQFAALHFKRLGRVSA